MATDAPFPLVIDKVKNTKLGKNVIVNLRIDFDKQTIADVRAMMVGITVEEVRQQTSIGNPPQRILVDGQEGKALNRVQRKVEVYYGVKLAQAAMNAVESALLQAIKKSTDPKTGRLADLSNWQWTLIQGGRSRVISSANDIQTFGYRDYLVLRPKLPYATLVSNVVAGTGKVTRKAKKQNVGMGILGYAAQKAKRTAALRDFTVYASRTMEFRVAGELSNTGTGFITIRAKRARRYRSLI